MGSSRSPPTPSQPPAVKLGAANPTEAPSDSPSDQRAVVAHKPVWSTLFHTSSADGQAYIFRPDIDDDTLRILIGRDDGINGPDLKSLSAKLPLTAEELKSAAEVLKTNEKLIDAIRDQLREQQRLIVELGKLQNPKEAGSTIDLERLGHLQSGLEVALERLKKEAVPTLELEKARNLILTNFYQQLKTIAGKANLLGQYEIFFGSYEKLFSYDQQIAAVSAADIQRVATKYFREQNRTVATLVPVKGGKDEEVQ